jgi:hypothetical protein
MHGHPSVVCCDHLWPRPPSPLGPPVFPVLSVLGGHGHWAGTGGGARTLRTRSANEDHEDGEDAPHDGDYWESLGFWGGTRWCRLGVRNAFAA